MPINIPLNATSLLISHILLYQSASIQVILIRIASNEFNARKQPLEYGRKEMGLTVLRDCHRWNRDVFSYLNPFKQRLVVTVVFHKRNELFSDWIQMLQTLKQHHIKKLRHIIANSAKTFLHNSIHFQITEILNFLFKLRKSIKKHKDSNKCFMTDRAISQAKNYEHVPWHN